jgi:hypothetical protein
MNLKQLIQETLHNYKKPQTKKCGCGCNTCNKAPILKENLSSRTVISENLKYHIEHKKPLTENTFRYGSKVFIDLWYEARQLVNEGKLTLQGLDKEILEETDLGKVAIYEGKIVALDMPLLEEEVNSGDLNKLNESIYTDPNTGKSYDLQYVSSKNRWELDITKKNSSIYDKVITIKRETVEEIIDWLEGYNIDSSWVKKSLNEAEWPDEVPSRYGEYIFKLDKVMSDRAKYKVIDVETGKEEIGGRLYGTPDQLQNAADDLIKPQGGRQSTYLGEAEYQGRKVDLNKPKRGGSKKFFVYVKDPKTKKVKKVSFGAKGGGQRLSVKLDDPKARAAFSKRHNCPQKKDKTTPGYWSCRINKYWKQLGGSKNYSGYW